MHTKDNAQIVQMNIPAMTSYRVHAHEEETVKSASSVKSASRNFPDKLHSLLTKLEEDGLSHLAHWAPHGRCFFVGDREKFVDKVLGRWFNMTKFESFQRQLNIYGFRRISQGKDKGGYYNELFLRGKPSVVNFIPRTQIKGKGLSQSNERVANPDFYSMESSLAKTANNGIGQTKSQSQGVPVFDLGMVTEPMVTTRVHPGPHGMDGAVPTANEALALRLALLRHGPLPQLPLNGPLLSNNVAPMSIPTTLLLPLLPPPSSLGGRPVNNPNEGPLLGRQERNSFLRDFLQCKSMMEHNRRVEQNRVRRELLIALLQGTMSS